MSRIDERLEIMGVDTSEMTTEEKFTAATGLTRYDADMAANDWYVPAGAANTPDEADVVEQTGEPTVQPTGEPTVQPTGEPIGATGATGTPTGESTGQNTPNTNTGEGSTGTTGPTGENIPNTDEGDPSTVKVENEDDETGKPTGDNPSNEDDEAGE